MRNGRVWEKTVLRPTFSSQDSLKRHFPWGAKFRPQFNVYGRGRMDRSRVKRWVCGGLLLLAGAAMAIIFQSGIPETRVEARTLTRAEAVRISRSLQQPGLILADSNQELAKVAKLLSPSVVHIQCRYPGDSGGTVEETGSGVVVSLTGAKGLYVVTNGHVVDNARQLENISIQFANGRYTSPVKVWEDKASDIGVLRLPQMEVVPANWGNSEELEIGHLVMALGSPFGLSQSVTLGIVSAKGRRSLELGGTGQMLNQNFIQTDAAINPGNSGGPLVDLHGHVVGINTAIASNSGGNEGIAFSIPSNLARRVAEALVRYGRVPRSYVGVKLDSSYSAKTAKKYGLKRIRGARVVQVYRGTPAADAGMHRDDLILEFNGIEVQGYNHLINLVSLTPVGKTVRLSVLRNGKLVSVDVVLADRAELSGHAEESRRRQTGGPRLGPVSPTRGRGF